MDVAMVAELITSLGFPIVCVIALGWFVFKIYNQSVQREALLMDEIKENRAINAKAIETISQYAERLTHIEDNIIKVKDDVELIKEKI